MDKAKKFEYLKYRVQEINDALYESLRLIDDKDWNNRVKKVVVVLSASRSGSSLVFNALTNSRQFIAPAGEHEPWLFLSGNKFPFTESDAVRQLNNKDRLLTLLRNDLLLRDDSTSSEDFFDLAWNRLTIRNELQKREQLEKLLTSYQDKSLSQNDVDQIMQLVDWCSISYSELGDQEFYWPIENPPYINQPLARRSTSSELSTKTLLFKSPSDAYRPGMYESLFPNADISYIHLTRGFAQTVNGLMDGWTKDRLDFSSSPLGLLESLNIKGYSNSKTTRNYWCFDLFPGWKDFTDASLIEVCVQQWLRAHTNILNNFPSAQKIQFESFYTDRNKFLRDLSEYTTVDCSDLEWGASVMSTDKPSQFRWKKREDTFTNLQLHIRKETLNEIVKLQQKLGYSMEVATWH